ncbi:MAG TPA: UDP-N-acetylmuramoyl-tripeptide--D-alanyl-D-alanine ligase [Mycobacteriales bacterium]|nr:UDP-N-acetylmuramoyl-tripeptide--D-alanyl-D-alanine ligase [Mycobacteriales bacterium]
MLVLPADEIAALSGGRLDLADPAMIVDGPVVIDSRVAARGSVFIALPGDHRDGHDFVGDAMRRGAVLAIVDRPVDYPAVIVDDVEKALGYLAGGVLRRTPGIRVCGVTGSSGKTSTKDLIASLLRRSGPTIAPQGSFNNEIGLPITVLDVDSETEHLVLEYSARGVGHIAYLTGIARPRIGVVLNVGTAHLGEFGSREAIAAAKGELIEALPADGIAVLNIDDPLVAAMASRTTARVVTYGEADAADVRIVELSLDEEARPRFRLVTPQGDAIVSMLLHGWHHASNAAAAAAVALESGMGLGEVAEVLALAVPESAHRMAVQRRVDGLLVVDDAYNANPESMQAALEALLGLAGPRGGATWAVLGEMRELGDDSPELHRATGRTAAQLGVDHLVVVGDVAAAIGEGARGVEGWAGDCTVVATRDEAADVAAAAGPEDVVLVKASNAARLWLAAERIVGGVAA